MSAGRDEISFLAVQVESILVVGCNAACGAPTKMPTIRSDASQAKFQGVIRHFE
jgi:hypothetical protein